MKRKEIRMKNDFFLLALVIIGMFSFELAFAKKKKGKTVKLSDLSSYYVGKNWVDLIPRAEDINAMKQLEEKVEIAKEKKSSSSSESPLPVPRCTPETAKAVPLGESKMPKDLAEGRELFEEAHVDNLLVQPPEDERWKPEEEAICSEEGQRENLEERKEESMKPQASEEYQLEDLLLHSVSEVRFGYQVCVKQAPQIQCSHRAFGHYVKNQLEVNACIPENTEDKQALIKPVLLEELQRLQTGGTCQSGPACNVYKQVLQKVTALIDKNGDTLSEREARKAIFTSLYGVGERSQKQVSETLLNYIYASTLVVLGQENPGELSIEIPHLVKAVTLSCRTFTYTRLVREELVVRKSGTSEEFSQGSHDYQSGAVNGSSSSLAETAGDDLGEEGDSCRKVNGRRYCD